MNRGTVRISKVGSDEVIAEFPFTYALTNLARVRLTNAGNTAILEGGSENAEALGLYVGYMAARLAHVEGLPEIKPEDVTYERMLEYSVFWDMTLELPQPDNDGQEGDDVDENPTDTPAGSSSD